MWLLSNSFSICDGSSSSIGRCSSRCGRIVLEIVWAFCALTLACFKSWITWHVLWLGQIAFLCCFWASPNGHILWRQYMKLVRNTVAFWCFDAGFVSGANSPSLMSFDEHGASCRRMLSFSVLLLCLYVWVVFVDRLLN